MAALRSAELAKVTALVNLAALRHEKELNGLVTESDGTHSLETIDCDDSTGSLGFMEAKQLKEHFLEGLPVVIGNHPAWASPTAVAMQEDELKGTVDIYVARSGHCPHKNGGADADCAKMFDTLGDAMGALQPLSTAGAEDIGHHDDPHRQALRNLTVESCKPEVDRAMEELEETFYEYEETCEDIFSDIFGIFDESRDTETAQLLSKLRDKHRGYLQGNVDKPAIEALLNFAFDAIRVSNIGVRLKRALGSVFGCTVLQILNDLARPIAAYHTIVRAAESLPTFRVVKFHYTISPLSVSCLPSKSLDLRDAFRYLNLPFSLPDFRLHIAYRSSLAEASSDFSQAQKRSAPIHVELKLLILLANNDCARPFPYIGRSNDCRLYGFLFYGLHDYFSARGYARSKPPRLTSLIFKSRRCPDGQVPWEKSLAHHLCRKPLETLPQLIEFLPRLTQLMAILKSTTGSFTPHRKASMPPSRSTSSTSSSPPASSGPPTSLATTVVPPVHTTQIRTASSNTYSICAHFIFHLVKKSNPLIHDEAYSLFGYTACQTDDQHQLLGGLYRDLFTTSSNLGQTIDAVILALENGTMSTFLDQHGWQLFREAIPRLETFFEAPLRERPTVWRLIRFIRDEDSPHACSYMKRDYGFHLCFQPDQVLRLKGIYARILEAVDPMDLHVACVNGKLEEFAMKHAGFIQARDVRLLRNYHPRPGLGVEDEEEYERFKKVYGFRRKGK